MIVKLNKVLLMMVIIAEVHKILIKILVRVMMIYQKDLNLILVKLSLIKIVVIAIIIIKMIMTNMNLFNLILIYFLKSTNNKNSRYYLKI